MADDRFQTVPGLLTARAVESPGRTAILLAGSGSLTFGEWEDRSTAIARGLLDRAVRRGDPVGLLFGEHDWIDYAAAYCAVHKAGGVAVPISARTPVDAVRHMLSGCSAVGLVHGREVPVPALGGWVEPVEALRRPGTGPIDVEVGADDLAQILFTSGTTGRPKGVTATHANLTYGYSPRMRRRPLAHSDHFLHAFPIGTNAAQTMLYNALVAEPAALTMPRFDTDEFCALIETYRVGTAFVVPAMAIDLINTGAHTRHDLSSVLLLGSTAAALPPAVAKTLTTAFRNADVVNYYSSTEAAPAQTVMIFDLDRPAAVGQVEEDDLMIADVAGTPLRPGEIGEVWLRSPTTQRAYLGDRQATAAVFCRGWTRMGDLGYLDDEGYLYLVDRESDIVKSGAFKISTLRIEAELYAHPEVAEAAALGLPHPVMGSIPAAAVVLRHPVQTDELRTFLTDRLARHEIPVRMLTLDSLPRNDAGKVVKGELRALFDAPVPAVSTTAPASGTEAALRRLWARVLGMPDVPTGADFFALGGDSFAAARLAAVASGDFAAEVPVSFAFDFPTLAAQTKEIESRRLVAAPAVGAVPRDSGIPLSSLQEYFLRWMHETPQPRAVSAVAIAITINDELDIPILRRALGELTARHDALRTVFPGGAHAVLLPERAPDFAVVSAHDERDALRLACAELERPFDLSGGPLLRALVIGLGPDKDGPAGGGRYDKHVLVVGVHHLVFDGHSMGVLLRELATLYAGYPLEPPPLGGADVSAWARSRWPAARTFWQQTLNGAPPALANAPGRRPANHFSASSSPVHIPAELAGGVRAVAAAHGSTVYMGLMAAWVAVLSEWAGSPEVVIMSPVPGRTRPEFDAVVGCLVQSLLLRVNVSDDPPYAELLTRVRRVVLAAMEHQYYPYEEFSREIPHPAWLRFERWAGPVHVPGLESEPFELPRELMFEWPLPDGEFDLSVPELALTEHPDGAISGWLVYNNQSFDRPTVERLARSLLTYLEHVQ